MSEKQGICFQAANEETRRKYLKRYYDDCFSPEVRKALQEAPYNLCEACLEMTFHRDVTRMVDAVRITHAMRDRNVR